MQTEEMGTLSPEAVFDRARRVIPGGVNSPVRAFGSVGGTPVFVAGGKGSRLRDIGGNEYIDLMASWGPLILGHAHPEVETAIVGALRNGTTFGAPTVAEIELAGRVVEMVPSAEMVRTMSSGTEATMTALRLARGATGRDRFVKFEGCYHGHSDSFLVKAGSGALTLGVPSSPGVPVALTELTLGAPYNDLDAVEALFERHGDAIACVFVEPVAGNMGVVPPRPGFLEGLRRLTSDHGALLVFDEVITGFRLAPGGAQERFGVHPDLTTLGKILGGGLPMGALAGRRDIMEQLAPTGPIYQAGTLSGNPLATAAGNAMLKILQEGGRDLYEELERKGKRLEDGIRVALEATGTEAVIQRVGSMMTLFFNDRPVESMHSLANVRTDTYGRFFHALLERGVCFPPSQYEAFFVSTAHDDATIDRVIEVVGEALKSMG